MKAIIFIAPPGAGKSTQADIFSRIFDMEHLDASRILQESLAKMDESDPVVKQAKSDYNEGRLMEPKFVANIIFKKIEEWALEQKSIVFSGSFRTIYEAENGLPLMENLYGRENIHIFDIVVSKEESVKRNLGRRVCEAQRHAIPNYESLKDRKTCPLDGSPLIRRSTDTAEVAGHRYDVYLEETVPVLEFMKKSKYEVVEIQGAYAIDEVTFSILAHLQLHPL